MKIQYLFLLFVFFLLAQASEAQPPSIEWQKSYGGTGGDVAQSMEQTTDCGFIIAGYSTSYDGDVTGQHGNADFWLCKLNHEGGLEWQNSYGGSSDDIAYSVKQTSDGGFIAVGFTLSNDGDVAGFHEGLQFGGTPTDLWVIKTDAAGQLQWQRSLGGKGREIGYSIQLTKDGGYIITGEANENDGDVTGYHTGTLFPHTPDLWVVKLTINGSIEWQKCYGSYLTEMGRSIKPTSDGGYIVTGNVQTTSPDTGDVKGIHNPSSGAITSDVWVLKLSVAGVLEWQRCLGGTGFDTGYDIIELSTGGFVGLALANSIDGDVIGGSLDYNLMWLFKLTNTGNIDWQYIHNVQYSIQPRNINEDNNGHFTIGAMRYYATETPDHQKYGTADYMIMKTDASGKPIWEKLLGGPGDDQGYMALSTRDNGYILCGSSTENGFDVSGNHGLEDFWVVKLNTLPIITIAASMQNICKGAAVAFTAAVTNGGGILQYQWLLNGKEIGIDSNRITLSMLQNSDTITCILTNPNGCNIKKDTSNSIIMTIKDEVSPTIFISAKAIKLCDGDTVLFNAQVNNIGTNTTYQWQVNSQNIGINSAQFSSTTLKNNDTATCILTTTTNCGTNQKIVSNSIVINSTPLVQTAVNIIASNDTICKGDLVFFNATASNTGVASIYQWQLNGQNIGNNEPILSLTSLNNGDKVNLIVRSDTLCPVNANPVSNTVTINFKPTAPHVNLGSDKRLCFETSTTLNPNFSYESYLWQNGSTATSFVTTFAGLYWVQVKDACGNISSDTLALDFFAKTKDLLPKDTSICIYETIELKPAVLLKSYKWSNFEQSATITIDKPGVYWVNGNDHNGCAASDTIRINLKNCIKGFYIPNAFTPNHDSKNERFYPLIFGALEKYEFRIFNRWGELVFESRKINEGWDGRFKGIDQPSSAFVWQCIFQFRNESTTYKKGTVLLLR